MLASALSCSKVGGPSLDLLCSPQATAGAVTASDTRATEKVEARSQTIFQGFAWLHLPATSSGPRSGACLFVRCVCQLFASLQARAMAKPAKAKGERSRRCFPPRSPIQPRRRLTYFDALDKIFFHRLLSSPSPEVLKFMAAEQLQGDVYLSGLRGMGWPGPGQSFTPVQGTEREAAGPVQLVHALCEGDGKCRLSRRSARRLRLPAAAVRSSNIDARKAAHQTFSTCSWRSIRVITVPCDAGLYGLLRPSAEKSRSPLRRFPATRVQDEPRAERTWPQATDARHRNDEPRTRMTYLHLTSTHAEPSRHTHTHTCRERERE